MWVDDQALCNLLLKELHIKINEIEETSNQSVFHKGLFGTQLKLF